MMVKEDLEKKPICRDYVRNICSRGESCKYRHPKQKYVFCHDYQNGKCSRVGCAFVHCSRDDEDHYNQYGELPPHLAELPNANLFGHRDVPICKDFLKGECTRSVCKFKHILLRQKPDDSEQHLRKRMRYEIEGPFVTPFDIPERSVFWTVEDENIILRKTVAELRKRVEDLQATNEFLLEQNAKMRISDKTSGLTAVTVPAVTITNATSLPQQVNGAIRTVATVPVSIAAVAGTPVSIAAVSMAPVQIPAPAVTMATQHHEDNTSQILSSQAPLVSYPIVARPVLPALSH